MEIKYCITPIKWGKNTEGYSTGSAMLYDSFIEALENAKKCVKSKQNPWEWSYAVCKIEAVVSLGEPEIELAVEGEKKDGDL